MKDVIHKLSTQMNVGQEAEGSGRAAGKRNRPSAILDLL